MLDARDISCNGCPFNVNAYALIAGYLVAVLVACESAPSTNELI